MREEEAMEETTTAVRSSPASPSGSESSPGALDAWESSIELTGKGPIKYSSRWVVFLIIFWELFKSPGLVWARHCCQGYVEWQCFSQCLTRFLFPFQN